MGDKIINFPPQGSPKTDWKVNYGILRSEINAGLPIKDTYRYGAKPIQARFFDPELSRFTGQFLNAERYILETRMWKYTPSSESWIPPK